MRVVSLSDAGILINIPPGSVDVEKLSYRTSPEGRLIVTDDETFVMDVNEFSRDR